MRMNPKTLLPSRSALAVASLLLAAAPAAAAAIDRDEDLSDPYAHIDLVDWRGDWDSNLSDYEDDLVRYDDDDRFDDHTTPDEPIGDLGIVGTGDADRFDENDRGYGDADAFDEDPPRYEYVSGVAWKRALLQAEDAADEARGEEHAAEKAQQSATGDDTPSANGDSQVVTIAGFRRIDVGQDERRVLVKAHDADDELLAIDLGPVAGVRDLDLEQGDRIAVRGSRATIDDQPLLYATSIELRSDPSRQRNSSKE